MLSGVNAGDERLEAILQDVRDRRGNVVVLTGAGISAESGIPTFRGTDGYWVVGSRNYMPQEMATRLNGCNDVTLGVNLVKAGIANNNLVLAVEQIVARQEAPKGKVQIATGLILQALQLWHRNRMPR